MIKVIIERHAKRGKILSSLLQELRGAAVTQFKGYLGGETLVSTEDSSIIIVISTWQSLEDWERWANSEIRARIYRQMEPLLLEKPKVRTFQVMATESKTDY